jgi:hypothetical protein
MRRKDDTGVEDAFSPVPHASGFRTTLLPGDGHNGKVYISYRPDLRKMMDMSTSSGVLSMTCLAVPVLCIPP